MFDCHGQSHLDAFGPLGRREGWPMKEELPCPSAKARAGEREGGREGAFGGRGAKSTATRHTGIVGMRRIS